MQVTIVKKEKKFEPVEVKIVFEIEKEVELLKNTLGQVGHSSYLYQTLVEILKGNT